MRTLASGPRSWCGMPVITGFLVVLIGLGRAECRCEGGNVPEVVLDADTPWVVGADQPEAIQRALDDVKADWYKVFGHAPIVLREPPNSWKGPLIYLGLKGGWRETLLKEPFAGAESFALRAARDDAGRPALIAAGGDLRGCIYAAYALSEEILGVDPWYYWVDKEPVRRDRIEVPTGFDKRFGPPTFKYRGWFINDEDLLGGFAPDALRENVFSLEMHDRICETLLRLRGNMIVPGTFVFPDERCQELASRRGLVLNMHHILVVGLNTYRWPKNVPFSYDKNPELMERYWQTCIDAFKGREVVWTVGYRGKHDRPFWVDEPELKAPAARGAVITRAIAKQVEMIRKVDPQAMIIANLWSEGAEMMHAGHLKLPADVVLVWPDDGTGLICDNGTVQAGQGTYYHTAMLNSSSNQLSEMVNPGRIHAELGRFARAGATNFFLVNVSDVRPVPLSTDCAMRFTWNAAPYLDKTDAENMDAFLVDWSRRQFGAELSEKAAAVYAEYFNIPYQRRSQRHGEAYLNTRLRALDRQAATLIAAGKPLGEKLLGEAADAVKFAGENRAYLAELLRKAESLAARIPDERRMFYQSHVLTPIRIHLHMLEILESYGQAVAAYGSGDKPHSIAHIEKSLAASDDLFAALHQAEYGKWSHWFLGERFVGVESSRDQLRVLAAALRGESPPPIRRRLGYEDLYEYQESFSKNFPLLYAPKETVGETRQDGRP
jgi:hypothetical protein